jgi:hypothetical protein
MDGTQHNITTFENLGANIWVKDLDMLKTSFPHPHPEANYDVCAILDPPHMIKLMRNALGDMKEFQWPGKGKIKWSYIQKLHDLQEEHSLRLANKISDRHIHFHKHKMKVSLAVQAIASRSVSKALIWAHDNEIPGFEENDVLVTAEFVELHDSLFDILNSRNPKMAGLKAAVTKDNIEAINDHFNKIRQLYNILIDSKGEKMIHSKRKCAFIGFLTCMKSVEMLYTYMESGDLDLDFFATYKFCQDHLEIFFNAVRLRNGWSFNPTPTQFRTAFRRLLVHAGKHVLGSAAANCISQDETAVMSIDRNSLARAMSDTQEYESPVEKNEGVLDGVSEHQCKISSCKFCSTSLSYIAGYLAFALKSIIKCNLCFNSLLNNPDDECADRSLILLKNYTQDESKGLCTPSGSLCSLLFHAEGIFRRNSSLLHDQKIIDKLLYLTLVSLPGGLFNMIDGIHAQETAQGIENHHNCLIHLVLKRYFEMRVKKYFKDFALKKKIAGNAIHRSRIFQNV